MLDKYKVVYKGGQDEIIEKIKDNYNGITDKEGCWEYLVRYYEMSEK